MVENANLKSSVENVGASDMLKQGSKGFDTNSSLSAWEQKDKAVDNVVEKNDSSMKEKAFDENSPKSAWEQNIDAEENSLNKDSNLENSKEVSQASEEVDKGIDNTKAQDNTNKLDETKVDHRDKEIPRINEKYEGQKYPGTDVEMVRKKVETDTGSFIERVFPKFQSFFDVKLPESLYKASDKKQFEYCIKQFKEKYEKDPDFRKKFENSGITKEMLNDKNWLCPRGYTWHHNEEKGVMQLVDYDTHAKVRHVGGRAIWGGGSKNR